MTEIEKPQHQRLSEERRRHRRAVDQLRGEYAESVEIDREYHDHQKRLQIILGPSESGIVDGTNRNY